MTEHSNLDPALAQARFGIGKKQGDKFVGLWLELTMAARRYQQGRGLKDLRATVSKFYDNPNVQAALAQVGEGAFNAELISAAELYFDTCKTDARFSSGLLGMSRLKPEQVRDKAEAEMASTAAALQSCELSGAAAELPECLQLGFQRSFGSD